MMSSTSKPVCSRYAAVDVEFVLLHEACAGIGNTWYIAQTLGHEQQLKRSSTQTEEVEKRKRQKIMA
jgi:hypothetical protein